MNDYRFSSTSLLRLAECDERLQRLMAEVLNYMDITILCGHRRQREQDRAWIDGKSQLQWPNSKHNFKPSLAVDVMPAPTDWQDIKRIAYMCGIIRGIAVALKIPVQLGIDWNSNGIFTDQKFHDLPHVELI